MCITNLCKFSCRRWVCIPCYSRMWMTQGKRYKSVDNYASLQHINQWLQEANTHLLSTTGMIIMSYLWCVICKGTHACRSCRPHWACIQADTDRGRNQANSHRCAHSHDLTPDTSPSLQIQCTYGSRKKLNHSVHNQRV